MKDLILEGLPQPRHNQPPLVPKIVANVTAKTLDVQSWQGFSNSQITELKTWLLEYKQNHSELLTFIGYFAPEKSFLPGVFVLPDSVRCSDAVFEACPLYNFSVIAKRGSETPTVIGSAEKDLLKIVGESYASHTLEFYWPVFFWLKKYLAAKRPQKFNLEFWMFYFNTSTSRRFFELITQLGEYSKESGCDLGIHWYVAENDIDMVEYSHEFKKSFPNLHFTINMVDKIDGNSWQ